MSEHVVVCRAIAGEAQKTVALLQRRHLHPVIMDEVEAAGGYRSHDRVVRIGVPATERDMAAAILAQAEQQSEASLAPTLRRIQVGFLLAAFAVIFVMLVGVVDKGGRWLAVLTMILCLSVAVLLLRWGWSRGPRD
jgi:hypothetical protein